VLFEFFRSAKRRTNSQQVRAWLGQALDSIEPFTESAALKAAAVEADLQQHGETLQMRDLLIASHARDVGATFVTYDRDDFGSEPLRQLLDVDVIAP
jgi:predicted nucleic acid-binding protein